VNGSDFLDRSEARIGMGAVYCKLPPHPQDVDEITSPHCRAIACVKSIACVIKLMLVCGDNSGIVQQRLWRRAVTSSNKRAVFPPHGPCDF
jgi:hypothetical protein